jgi:hypothetical protein
MHGDGSVSSCSCDVLLWCCSSESPGESPKG